ncbi:GTP cyclohydrolase II / 3,4-dihydroxy-2-butanone-4-phosphate synthase [Bacillus thuringiensis serovar israelensis ATCC 35646]|nr:GTP cyclohydrolase II / 3,4-dihydroxy-2-butanone-4-phosphate synthase [Bacillus thuringiensis serovar israelensis ATCC 35646]
MITHGRGLVCVPITEGYAERLQLEPMVSHNTDSHHTAFTREPFDMFLQTTGICGSPNGANSE